MQSFIIGSNQAGQRLDKFLNKFMPNAGSGFLYKMLRKKNITLNGKKAEGKEILQLDDKICFYFADETYAMFTGQTVPSADTPSPSGNKPGNILSILAGEYLAAYENLQSVSVLFETEDVLIVNKPAGILTQKALPEDLSLNEWLIGYLLQSKSISEEELRTFRPSVCNRLDRNTSGIVLCGKSLKGSQVLSRMIKDRSIRKFYRTICIGKLTEKATLEGILHKDTKTNRVTLRNISAGNKTEHSGDGSYICTKYFPINGSDAYTLLEVELITGKTHQIRAHLASIGHALAGDFKYGIRSINNRLKEQYKLEYHLLHAYRVKFPADCPLEDLRDKEIICNYPEMFNAIAGNLGLI